MNGRNNSRGEEGASAAELGSVADAWVRASEHVANSVVEANRAALAAFGFANGAGETATAGVDSVAYDRPDWVTERSVADPEAIAVGDAVRFSKSLSDADVRHFAEVSGDTNRLHLDDEFAAETRFGGRIVHGSLVTALVSAALARLPGLTIYLSQDARFAAPVDVGERLTATAEVVEDLGDGRYRLTTTVVGEDEDSPYVSGEAVVLVDDLPEIGERTAAADEE
jgi:acyl dehydratase